MAKCANCGEEMVAYDGYFACETCGAKLVLQNSASVKADFAVGTPQANKRKIIARLVALRVVLKNIEEDRSSIENKKYIVKQKEKEVKTKNLLIESLIADKTKFERSDLISFLICGLFTLAAIVITLLLLLKRVIPLSIESTFLYRVASGFIVIAAGVCGLILGKLLVSLFRLIDKWINEFFYHIPVEDVHAQITKYKNEVYNANQTIVSVNKQIMELQKRVENKERISVDTFGDLIPPTDFQNTDYLLYLFITKRVDTIKESLQLLDEQKKNNQLMGKIQESSEYLSRNLEVSIKSMKSEINSELFSISNLINYF